MKLDYDYIKVIIEAFESHPSHLFLSTELAKRIGSDLNDEGQLDKFYGHIRLLADDGFIDSPSVDYGYVRCNGGDIAYYGTDYRLTSRGYELLDMLREDTVFNNIKKFSISTAYDIGKSLLIKAIEGFVPT